MQGLRYGGGFSRRLVRGAGTSSFGRFRFVMSSDAPSFSRDTKGNSGASSISIIPRRLRDDAPSDWRAPPRQNKLPH